MRKFNIVLAFCVFVSMAETSKLASVFVRKSLDIQFGIALKVVSDDRPKIYLFDSSGIFTNATYQVVDGYRVSVGANGEYGLLSQAAQGVFLTSNTYLQFLG